MLMLDGIDKAGYLDCARRVYARRTRFRGETRHAIGPSGVASHAIANEPRCWMRIAARRISLQAHIATPKETTVNVATAGLWLRTQAPKVVLAIFNPRSST